MNFKLTSFGKPNARRSLFYTLEVTSRVRDTKASSEYIFSKMHPYIQQTCILQHQEII